MKVVAFNGSPRKKWNTATLLQKALQGAAAQGAETELIHLYDLDFKGCKSCFACKTRGGKSYGKCAVVDELTPILKMVRDVDAMLLGTPVYFGAVSGEMKSFMERLMFPYRTYTEPQVTLYPRQIRTGFIYTMNVTETDMKKLGYPQFIDLNEMFLKAVFGSAERLLSFDTYQFDDYSKMVAERFDVVKKEKRRKEVFPIDFQKAFELGCRLVR